MKPRRWKLKAMVGIVRRDGSIFVLALAGLVGMAQACQSDSTSDIPGSMGGEGIEGTGADKPASELGSGGLSSGGRSSGGRSPGDDGGPDDKPDPVTNLGGMGGDHEVDPPGEQTGRAKFLEPPTIVGNSNPFVPQAAVLTVKLDHPSALRVRVEGAGESWDLDFEPTTDLQTPIVGVLPDTEYTVVVSATRESLTTTSDKLKWASPALPEELQGLIDISIADVDRMEPGMTFFSPSLVSLSGKSPSMVVDKEGRIRWYYWDPSLPVASDARVYENGDIMMQYRRCEVRIFDFLGELKTSFYPALVSAADNCHRSEGGIPVQVSDMHHEMGRPPELDGNYLTISNETRMVDDFPTSDIDPNAPTETARIISSVIVEFEPDGTIVRYLVLADIGDPQRIGHDSLNGSEWDHANAVIYEESSDSYYVSQRHQDAVLKIRRSNGELVWILGNHANYGDAWTSKLLTPVGDLVWQYHQHAVELTPWGLGLFDNGNFRAPAYQEAQKPNWSRAVIFSIDEEAMTVREEWSYGAPEAAGRFYSYAQGDADWQPITGNCLITNSVQAEIFEVTHDGEMVFRLKSKNTGSIYRAQRLPDIRTDWTSN